MEPFFSIIIPTKNGEKTLQRALESWLNQTLSNQTEIIIIDSGSTDNTLKIVRQYPVRIFTIRPEEFSHSQTRNYAVTLSRGKFILMTVQDAWASSNKLLEKALQHFNDEQTMAIAGSQAVPKELDKNPLQWYRPISQPRTTFYQFKPEEFEQLSPEKKLAVSRLDDVCAFYRKTALLELPFPKTEFAEDILWAMEAYKRGWKIVFDPEILVWHYHHYDSKQKFLSRKQAEKNLLHQLGVKAQKRKHFSHLLRIFYLTFIKRGYVPQKKLYWLGYNLKLWWWNLWI